MADGEKRRAYGRAYSKAHRKEKTAYIREWRIKHPFNHKTAHARAVYFLHNSPDCTSTLEEVEAIYAASIDATTGEPGTIGQRATDLQLDHIHNGPALALVPSWLNKVMTKRVDDNWPMVRDYIERRLTWQLK